MLKKLIIIALLSFAFVFSQEQSLNAQFISSQKIDADNFIGFDDMDNQYYIKNNVLHKKNRQELWQYKNVSLGRPTRIDFQNQLKIMLLYENFNTVVLLDNQLNEIQKINFSETETPILISATGIASQNRLWIYNSLNQQIGLFDVLKNSYLSLTPSFEGNFKHYFSDFNTFQWIDDKLDWYNVDVFGKISTIGKVADFEKIKIISNSEVLFSKDGKLFLNNVSTNSIYTIEDIEKSFKDFFYKDQNLTIFTNKEILNYKINKP